MAKKSTDDKPLVALHGFLGEPSDFAALGLDVHAPKVSNWPLSGFSDWALEFNREVNAQVLLGYSMGGRLALHSLVQRPVAKAAIIVAAHPGLKTKPQKQARILNDQKWAQRFRTKPWSVLMDAWNGQKIFASSRVIDREEKNFSRAELASYLDSFSLGRQEDLRASVNQLPMPILWLAPESESAAIEGINLKNSWSKMILVKGGHRFIFDEPLMVARLIKDFLARLP